MEAAAPPYLAPGRDLRLDFFRGLALWFIFLDHIPDNIVSWLTVRNYGFSDATEIFVFISGYTAVIAYSRMMLRDGWPRAASRIYRRVWQLYVAHILLFVAFTAQIAYVSISRDTPELIEEMQLLGLGENPYRAILEAALLKYRPVNLDVLPLYIVLLAGFPLALPGLLRWPHFVIGLSLVVYAVTLHFDWNLPGYPDDKVWFFNPMAWQVVFYSGAVLAVVAPELAMARSLARDDFRACRRFTSPSPPLSPCPGSIIRWNASFRTGLPGRSIRSTRPTLMSCDSFTSWHLAWLVRLASAAKRPISQMARFGADSQMRRAFLADILLGYVSCCHCPDHRRPLRRFDSVATRCQHRRYRHHVPRGLCRELVQGRPSRPRIRRVNGRALLAFVATALVGWSATANAEMQCRASRELLDIGNPLEIARTAVAEERELRIVAMGSSSTQGYGASNPKYAYPAQLKIRARGGDAGHLHPCLQQGHGRPGR